MVRVGSDDLLDLGQGQGDARGGVGVGQDRQLARAGQTGHVHGKVLMQGDGGVGDAVQVGEDGVEAIRQVGEHGPVLAEGHKSKVQNIVRTVGQKDLVSPHAVQPGQGQLQCLPFRVGVEPQIPDVLLTQGRKNGLGGGIGGLVGVELDVLLVPGLLAGGIGF